MQVIYHAENVIDANLLKGLLEQQGIMAFVNGQYLQGGIGELPASGLISVSVSNADLPKASSVVAKFVADLATHNGQGETRWDPNHPLADWKG